MLPAILALSCLQTQAPATSLPPDGVVKTSLALKGGRSTRRVDDNQAALVVASDDVTIDLGNGVLTAGAGAEKALDSDTGVGILVKGRKNVTIRNAKVRGYRWNIRIEDSVNVRVENCDVSGSRAQRIWKDGHSLDVWLELRNLDAWRSYGAGVWLEACKGCTVTSVRGCHSQNGLLMVDCAGSTILDDDFSFNSGWGIGLWHSASNAVVWNHLDFDNRPWSGGWGGDSAALSVANGSSHNYFVGNSMTHGGDGFFLTDRVNGGFDDKTKRFDFDGDSSDNVIAYSDGSYSTANAFEGTFSDRNVYFKNVANDSEYGFWIGFSNDSLVARNTVMRNRHSGIAGGQGARSRIELNQFGDNVGPAVELWSDPGPADRQRPSEDHEIADNELVSGTLLSSKNASGSVFDASGKPLQTFGTPGSKMPQPFQTSTFESSPAFARLTEIVALKPAGWKSYSETTFPKGWDWIAPNDFAPRDFRDSLAAVRKVDASTLELYLLRDGIQVSAPYGLTYGAVSKDPHVVRLLATPSGDGVGRDVPYRILLAIDGKRREAFSGSLSTIKWDLAWYRWDQPKPLSYDDVAGWQTLFAGTPLATDTKGQLDDDFSGRSPAPGLPADHFALVATSKANFKQGVYSFDTVSDDGIRLFLDGKEIVSRWNHHGPTPDHVEVPVKAGVHALRVEYCQEDGAAVLRVAWRKQ